MAILSRPEPDPVRSPRKWTLPPPPLRQARPFEGAEILDEVAGPLGLLLWLRVRDVLLWADVAPAQRADLFSRTHEFSLPDESTDRNLRRAVGALSALVRSPEAASADGIAAACIVISDWAAEAGLAATECSFGEAAAYVLPSSAHRALYAGRIARRQAAYERAQQWFVRAIALARRAQDWPTYTLTFISWASMDQQRGRLKQARRRLSRAWKAAKRFKLRELGAYVQHDLLLLSYEIGTFQEGQEHANAALRLYRGDAERLPQLAHDTAFLWMHHGYFGAALPVFLAALPFIRRASERVQVQANIGRAAAVLGNQDLFFESWDAVTSYSATSTEYLAASLLNIAHGAWTLGLRRQAQRVASEAAQVARKRGEVAPEELAVRLFEGMREGSPPERDRNPLPDVLEMQALLLRQLCALAAPE